VKTGGSVLAAPDRRQLQAAYLRCIALNLRKTARAVSALYDGSVRRAGLRATQFQILATLALFPRTSITRLSASIEADRTTIQRSLERLVTRGWVSSTPGAIGNVRELELTVAGRRKLAQAYKYWEAAQSTLVSSMGSTEVKQFLRDLRAVRRLAARYSGEGAGRTVGVKLRR
jgi:DNA-binding MarR family transcriptional regulator